jgi:cytochrome bd-type quinol oxidase subunit 1
MALFGWYILTGFVLCAVFTFNLLKNSPEGKLRESSDLAVAFGGMIVLLLWPFVLGTALLGALRKRPPDE